MQRNDRDISSYTVNSNVEGSDTANHAMTIGIKRIFEAFDRKGAKVNHKRVRIQVPISPESKNLEKNFKELRKELLEDIMNIADKLANIIRSETLHPKYKRGTFEDVKEIIRNYQMLSAQLTPSYYNEHEIEAFVMKYRFVRSDLEIIHNDALQYRSQRMPYPFLEEQAKQEMQPMHGEEELLGKFQNFFHLEEPNPYTIFEKNIKEQLSEIKKEVEGVIQDKKLLDQYAKAFATFRTDRKIVTMDIKELQNLENFFIVNAKDPLKAGIQKETITQAFKKLKAVKNSIQKKQHLFNEEEHQKLHQRLGIVREIFDNMKTYFDALDPLMQGYQNFKPQRQSPVAMAQLPMQMIKQEKSANITPAKRQSEDTQSENKHSSRRKKAPHRGWTI